MVLKISVRVLILAGALIGFALHTETRGQTPAPIVRLAVLDFGGGSPGRHAAQMLADSLKAQKELALIDRDQSRSAAVGVGYSGSLNLSLTEARDLGAALGADYFVLGDAQTLRRSPSTLPVYFESYASVFLVSTRTGRLAMWRRPNFRAAKPESAERLLLSELTSLELRQQMTLAIRKAHENERSERAVTIDSSTPVFEAAPDDEKKAESDGLRLPRPYRRLIPAYTETAADAEAEATVDVFADIDARGDVTRVEVARWAGFGLDESTIETVKRLQFFPAQRNGVAIPIRVLLRYNFRKPPK